MRQAANIKGWELPMLLPGIKVRLLRFIGTRLDVFEDGLVR